MPTTRNDMIKFNTRFEPSRRRTKYLAPVISAIHKCKTSDVVEWGSLKEV